MNLNELRERAYKIACEHGWHDKEQNDETYLMLIITEIAEAVNADRKNKHADVSQFKEYQTYYGSFLPSKETREIRFKEDFEAYIKDSVCDELADVVIRCLDLFGLKGHDIDNVEDFKSKMLDLKPGVTFPYMCFILCTIITDKISIQDSITEVLAVVIRYCEIKGIDLEWFIEQKMKYNELRPYKHGGKAY